MPRTGALKPEIADGIRELGLGALRTSGVEVASADACQEPPWYGTVCPVVWEEAGVIPPPTQFGQIGVQLECN